MLKTELVSLPVSTETRYGVEANVKILGELTMRKLLLLTSILTIMLSSFSFAKTYSIKKERKGKYVEISQGDIEVVLSKGEVFQQQISGNSFINIIKYDKKVFYCFTNVFLTSDVQNVCRTWVNEDKE